MSKRRRSEEPTKDDGLNRFEKSPEPNRRFLAFVRRWQEDVENPEAVQRPSSMRPLCPFQTMVHSLRSLHPLPRREMPSRQQIIHTAISGPSCETASGTGVVYDEYMLQHISTDPNDVERPSRLERTIAHLTAIGLLGCCVRIEAKKATTRDLRRVHTREHIDYVDQLDFFMQFKDAKSMSVGPDLYACQSTSKVARMAAGSVVEAALAVAAGSVRNAFAFVRPPGHHACAQLPSGFCFFNNVAVAARAVQETLSKDTKNSHNERARILILDWDVHHCDGTESIFYEDPSVMVISIHQYGKGRGHLLRKPSSQVKGDEVAAGACATTLSQVQAPRDSTPTELSLEALGMLLPTEEDIQAVDGEVTEVQNFPHHQNASLSLTTEKRKRKPVDYARLAADLEVDDNEVAAMFGVNIQSLSTPPSQSTSTPDGDSSPHGEQLGVGSVFRHPGDTEALSGGEESMSSGFASDEEPFYPGTGHSHRLGGEQNIAARGRNLNIPWPTHNMGDLEYLHVLNEIVVPVMVEFQPKVVFISSGFDAAAGDLLGSMKLTASGYYMMTKIISHHSERLVVALEGGYNVSNVALCSEAVLRALLEDSFHESASALPRSRMLLAQSSSLVESLKEQYKPFFKCFRDISPIVAEPDQNPRLHAN